MSYHYQLAIGTFVDLELSQKIMRKLWENYCKFRKIEERWSWSQNVILGYKIKKKLIRNWIGYR